MTEDCNFRCSYCYQKKRKKYLDYATIEKAVDFFLPRLTEECYINFHGGEPLLAFDKIEHTLNLVDEKNKILRKRIHYAIVTNGSLITDEILHYLRQDCFSILLSFDGIAQDVSREKGSSEKIIDTIGKLLKCPEIELEVCSVFTPETVGYISESLRFIMELGVPNISLSLSTLRPWDSSSLLNLEGELISMQSSLLSYYRQLGIIPLISFRKESERGFFFCAAGQDRLALDTDGNLWGCYLFPDYFKEKENTNEYSQYCFGGLDSFIERYEQIYPEVRKSYARLRMSNFYTSCMSCIDCSELLECTVCPIEAALASSKLGKIPDWTCKIKKILRKQREIFWRELGN